MHIFLVKHKNEFITKFEEVINWYTQHGHRICKLRNDAGTVELDIKVLDLCQKYQIIQEDALPEAQYQNPVERTIQTSVKHISSIMLDQNVMGPACWGMAALFWCQVSNATPNSLTGGDNTYPNGISKKSNYRFV